MTRYFDADGNEQSAQDRYDESQVREHGGSSGNWTDEPEPEPSPAPEPYHQPNFGQESAYAPQEPTYDEGLDSDDLYDAEPGEFDPLAPDAGEQIRQMIREETGLDGQSYEQQAWQGDRNAEAMAGEIAATEAGYAELEAVIDQAVHGKLGAMGEHAEPFAAGVAQNMQALAAETASNLLANGFSAEELGPALERAMPAFAERGVELARHYKSVEDMRAQVKAHFGQGRS